MPPKALGQLGQHDVLQAHDPQSAHPSQSLGRHPQNQPAPTRQNRGHAGLSEPSVHHRSHAAEPRHLLADQPRSIPSIQAELSGMPTPTLYQSLHSDGRPKRPGHELLGEGADESGSSDIETTGVVETGRITSHFPAADHTGEP